MFPEYVCSGLCSSGSLYAADWSVNTYLSVICDIYPLALFVLPEGLVFSCGLPPILSSSGTRSSVFVLLDTLNDLFVKESVIKYSLCFEVFVVFVVFVVIMYYSQPAPVQSYPPAKGQSKGQTGPFKKQVWGGRVFDKTCADLRFCRYEDVSQGSERLRLQVSTLNESNCYAVACGLDPGYDGLQHELMTHSCTAVFVKSLGERYVDKTSYRRTALEAVLPMDTSSDVHFDDLIKCIRECNRHHRYSEESTLEYLREQHLSHEHRFHESLRDQVVLYDNTQSHLFGGQRGVERARLGVPRLYQREGQRRGDESTAPVQESAWLPR